VRRAVLFDLDGTLTDSARGITSCIRYALESMGQECPPDEHLRQHLGPPLAVTFGEHFGMDEAGTRVAIEKYRERYHDVGLFENSVYEGIPDALAGLAAGGSTLAVATSKPTVSATRILEHFGLAGHFAFIGGAELDGSRDTKAAVIAHTLRSIGIDPDHPGDRPIVMVGDREHDVIGAREHGIETIGVLWGYGSADELRDAGAIALAESVGSLALVIDEFATTS
jgi:phosphoglycolate phosphatase